MAVSREVGVRLSSPGGRSGVVELAVDGAEDEAGRLRAFAAQLLALVLLERRREVGEEQHQLGRPLELACVEGGREARDRGSGVVDDVAFRLDPLANLSPCRVRRGTGAG